MRKKLLPYFIAAVSVLASCVDNGGYEFGVLPEGVATIGDALEVSSASYDEVLHELRVTWKSTPDASYKGVEVTFKTLSGGTKTSRILANTNFPTSYSFFTVLTSAPKDVTFRCLWNSEDGEKTSDWLNFDDISIKTESATKRFVTLQMPTFYFYDKKPGTTGSSLYNEIVGETETAKKAFYSEKIKRVLSAAYFSTADAGERPVDLLQCFFEPSEHLAYVSGNSVGPLMVLGYEYVQDLADQGGATPDAIFEINGVILHEFTHLIQAKPKAATDIDYGGCIEGYADAIRCATGGVTDQNRINTGKNSASKPYHDAGRKNPYIWQEAYGTSGYFMDWLRYYDGDFLRKLSTSMNKIDSNWTLEVAIKYILGENYRIKDLWEEYITDVQKESSN